ncbi:HEAT repeat domain-containing protein [Clostridium manihotivorum]|uniref:HEAT repeat domain-containing protein n=1 Tax=Clostridium manihotivorum TaxID=2320868 RepID=A0A410DZH0_9CLOT|nr:HEAT repeat domain-containing protein [Clostridium manihotivorum]QAA34472.1 hypothetical protein C1I91_24090 [Clostridium manihotivorum]
MGQYVYLSIIFFSIIIFFLYIYILYEKPMQTYKFKKIEKYSKEIIPSVDSVIKVITEEEHSLTGQRSIKAICKNKVKREIVEERLLFHLGNADVSSRTNIINLSERIEVIKYEIDNLKNNNYFKKAYAAKRLGDFRSKLAVEPLLAEVDTKNSDVKYNILLSLAKIGDEEAFIKAFEDIDSAIILSERSLIEIVDSFEGDRDKIYKYMINSTNSFIASVFIKSAGNCKYRELSEEISKYLYSEDKELKIASLKALGNMGSKEYLENMIKLLEDGEWEVRAVAARSLGNFSEEEVLLPLAKALSDQQWYVRYNAATAILNHNKGMSIVSYVFQGNDKFAKDIIISAIENSPKGVKLYENSEDPDQAALAAVISDYRQMNTREDIA